ncbi:MAG: helix-turn-helix domain-containing protein [Thermodesulfobacteriota bacterium]
MADKQIGRRIKLFRKDRGISQIELAGKIGVSFQQVQKYEKGATRISVARLQDIAEAMGVDIGFFFEEKGSETRVSDQESGYSPRGDHSLMLQYLSMEERVLLKLFRKIDNKKIREGIVKQLRGIVEVQERK